MTSSVNGTDAKILLALDRYKCYPMETVTLFIRVTLPKRPEPCIYVGIPRFAHMQECRVNGVDPIDLHVYLSGELDETITIPIGRYFRSDESTEIQIDFQLDSMMTKHWMLFEVSFTPESERKEQDLSLCAVQLEIRNRGTYMSYIPEIYDSDEFMNRFLMFFESFWKPISTQIGQVENYFDPDLTPDAFVPWLASWLGLEVDETLPQERVRKMIKKAISFYHCRGTLRSLKEYLEMFTDGEVIVEERRAHNMTLGKDTKLGAEIAVGVRNQPNTVFVSLKITKDELKRTGFTRIMYEQKIATVIRKIIPAHACFSLSCDYL